ncbi:MAG: nucleoside monophosphate kinase [Chlamydiia bacterium]|nr:nucleoside monophosphate kinase [Chlamydiia bacterium]
MRKFILSLLVASFLVSACAALAGQQVFVLVGPPGVGKSTQARYIQEVKPLPHISVGDLLRAEIKKGTALGVAARTRMANGQLVPNSMVIGMLKQRVSEPDCTEGYIMDGYPRAMEQMTSFEELTKDCDVAVINLIVDDAVVKDRILGRAAKLPPEQRREDDTEEVLAKRLEVFHRESGPVLEYFQAKGLVTDVDATLEQEKVFAFIRPLMQ